MIFVISVSEINTIYKVWPLPGVRTIYPGNYEIDKFGRVLPALYDCAFSIRLQVEKKIFENWSVFASP